MAINMGGDDFVTKPFDQNVLLAKVQGLLRRSYAVSYTHLDVYKRQKYVSQGMILSAEHGDQLTVLTVDPSVPNGSIIG